MDKNKEFEKNLQWKLFHFQARLCFDVMGNEQNSNMHEAEKHTLRKKMQSSMQIWLLQFDYMGWDAYDADLYRLRHSSQPMWNICWLAEQRMN